ncbi:hypothetical protein J7L87_00600 [bacterium]|nr:hypothetical protein [bacterium]
MEKKTLIIFIFIFSFLCFSQNSFSKSYYWYLGVGSYGAGAGEFDKYAGFTYLDRARMDWVMLTFGNPPGPSKETTEMLNKFLEINPELKIMVRLWPICNLGYKENRYMATFLDYLYKPGVKEKIFKEIKYQIHSVLDYITKPENVVGFVFLEELPGHFTDMEIRNLDEDKLGPSLLRYKKQIEKERGKPLKWDEETRRWWGRKFAEVLNEINSYIKKESGGRWVFVWIQTNHETLDFYPKGVSLKKRNLLPIYYSEIIKKGVADGFFAYPNNRYVWNRYLELARKHNWLFFSQLSHPGGMRLCRWEEAIKLAETKVPQNLGYFFYCEGNCYRGEWNDDKSIPPDDNYRKLSIVSHYRRFCAQRRVGMKIINKYLLPEIKIKYDSEGTKIDGYMGVRIIIHNVRDTSWYLKKEEAVLKNVKVSISIPEGYSIQPYVSPPPVLKIGNISADEYISVIWWLKKIKNKTVSKTNPLIVKICGDNFPEVKRIYKESKMEILPEKFFIVRKIPAKFLYPAFNLKGRDLKTKIILECLSEYLTEPSILFNNDRVIWTGTLQKGEKLIIEENRARLVKEGEVRDVSDKLMGKCGKIEAGKMNYLTFSSADVSSPLPKAKIYIEVEKEEKK